MYLPEVGFSQNENRIASTIDCRYCAAYGSQVQKETRVRIGLMIGADKGRYRQKVAQLVADAEAAENAGFTSIWMPQVPGDFDAFTAIIVPPQAAILAVGAIADRVVAVNGQPAVRPVMSMTLSCDHRIASGVQAAEFMRDLANAITSAHL